jgi:hypothetical protein
MTAPLIPIIGGLGAVAASSISLDGHVTSHVTSLTPITSAEAWRDEMIAACPEVYINFVLRWLQVESGGNQCSTGMGGREAGIAQIDFLDGPTCGTSFQALRAYCSGQQQTRGMTADERRVQVTSAAALIRKCLAAARGHLAASGLSWSNDDTLRLAKMVHALPLLARYVRVSRGVNFAAYEHDARSLDRASGNHALAPLGEWVNEFPRLFRNVHQCI